MENSRKLLIIILRLLLIVFDSTQPRDSPTEVREFLAE